jgi:hypothetical protein
LDVLALTRILNILSPTSNTFESGNAVKHLRGEGKKGGGGGGEGHKLIPKHKQITIIKYFTYSFVP